jgi:hypothetical protein
MKSFSGLYPQYGASKLANYNNGFSSTLTNSTLNKSASNKKFIKPIPLKNKNVFQSKIKSGVR